MLNRTGYVGFWLGLAVLLVSACRPISDAWEMGWTGAAAKDQIMLVRDDPPSLGLRRLLSQSAVYPDLGTFLHIRGLPDFVAETNAADRHFLILYYLKTQSAYACGAKLPRTRRIEFSGPYAITRREYHLLVDFQKKSAGQSAAAAGR